MEASQEEALRRRPRPPHRLRRRGRLHPRRPHDRPPPPPPRPPPPPADIVGMFGSAPYFTSSFIASTSVPYAARQNAVEPVTFERPQFALPQSL